MPDPFRFPEQRPQKDRDRHSDDRRVEGQPRLQDWHDGAVAGKTQPHITCIHQSRKGLFTPNPKQDHSCTNEGGCNKHCTGRRSSTIEEERWKEEKRRVELEDDRYAQRNARPPRVLVANPNPEPTHEQSNDQTNRTELERPYDGPREDKDRAQEQGLGPLHSGDPWDEMKGRVAEYREAEKGHDLEQRVGRYEGNRKQHEKSTWGPRMEPWRIPNVALCRMEVVHGVVG